MKRGANHQARRVGAALLLAACQPSNDATSSATEALDTTQNYDTYGTTIASSSATLPQETSPDGSTASTANTGSTGSTTASTGDPTGDPTNSTGDPTDATTTDDTSGSTTGQQVKSCKKVDILFFIDNTNEMWGAEYGLQTMMPHLAERVETEFADWDYHMMVIKGDDTWGDNYCEQRCEQGGAPCQASPPYPCDHDPNMCDLTLGAGVNFPAGGEASNIQCPIDGDKRYISTGQTDLAGTLECLRKTGYGYEFPGTHRIVRSVLDSLGDPLNGPGGCNEGFLRDDAYLIIFMVSPLPDIYTEGTAADWTKELKAHKGGKFDKIFFIGLFKACDHDYGQWKYESQMDWVDSLYHSKRGHACNDELIEFIDPALDYIQSDCQE